MSYVFDVGSRALAEIEQYVSDEELRLRFRFFFEELHEANHRLKDAVNHDAGVVKKANELAKYLDHHKS